MKAQSYAPKIKKILKYWLPVVLWMSVIFLFSSHPTGQASEIHWKDFFVKKNAHIVEYAILAGFLFRAFKNSGIDAKRSAWSAFLLAVVYGATDEYHQSFTPGRQPNARDVIFDTIGAAIATTILWKYLPIMPKRLKNWAKKLDLL